MIIMRMIANLSIMLLTGSEMPVNLKAAIKLSLQGVVENFSHEEVQTPLK